VIASTHAHTCTDTYKHTYTHAYAHTYLNVSHTETHTHTRAHTQAQTLTQRETHTHTYTFIYKCTHTQRRTYTYIHSLTQSHTNTQTFCVWGMHNMYHKAVHTAWRRTRRSVISFGRLSKRYWRRFRSDSTIEYIGTANNWQCCWYFRNSKVQVLELCCYSWVGKSFCVIMCATDIGSAQMNPHVTACVTANKKSTCHHFAPRSRCRHL